MLGFNFLNKKTSYDFVPLLFANVEPDQVSFKPASEGISPAKGFIKAKGEKAFVKLYADEERALSLDRVSQCLKNLKKSNIPDFLLVDDFNIELFGRHKPTDASQYKFAFITKFLPPSKRSATPAEEKELKVNYIVDSLMTIRDRKWANTILSLDGHAYSIDHENVFYYNSYGKKEKEIKPIQSFKEMSVDFRSNFQMPADDFEGLTYETALFIEGKFEMIQEILKPDEFEAVQKNVSKIIDELKV